MKNKRCNLLEKILVTTVLSVLVFSNVNTNIISADGQTNSQNVLESSGRVVTLASGHYIVEDDATFSSGIVIPAGNEVYIEVPEGKTLTCTGINATTTQGFSSVAFPNSLHEKEAYHEYTASPSTPGILVEEGATLYLTGEGNVVAKGGNGTKAGDAITNSTITYKARFSGGYLFQKNATIISGFGMRGGGASAPAAAIGGKGGIGGVTSNISEATFFGEYGQTSEVYRDYVISEDGINGNDGGDGQGMGTVYIVDSLNVTATAGSNISYVGKSTNYALLDVINTATSYYSDNFNVVKMSSGATGGGGGSSSGAAIIGGGGAGGGGGASGTSGSFFYDYDGDASTAEFTTYYYNGKNGSATKGGDGGLSRTIKDPGETYKSLKPGVGGDIGTAGEGGQLYVTETATINGKSGAELKQSDLGSKTNLSSGQGAKVSLITTLTVNVQKDGVVESDHNVILKNQFKNDIAAVEYSTGEYVVQTAKENLDYEVWVDNVNTGYKINSSQANSQVVNIYSCIANIKLDGVPADVNEVTLIQNDTKIKAFNKGDVTGKYIVEYIYKNPLSQSGINTYKVYVNGNDSLYTIDIKSASQVDIDYKTLIINLKKDGSSWNDTNNIVLNCEDSSIKLNKSTSVSGQYSTPISTKDSKTYDVLVNLKSTGEQIKAADDPKNIDYFTASATVNVDSAAYKFAKVYFKNGDISHIVENSDTGIYSTPLPTIKDNNGQEIPWNIEVFSAVDNVGHTVTSTSKATTIDLLSVKFMSTSNAVNIDTYNKTLFRTYLVSSGGSIKPAPDSYLAAMTFECWNETPYAQGEGKQTPFDFSTPITASKLLYAHFVAPEININDYVKANADSSINGTGEWFKMPNLSVTGYGQGNVIKTIRLTTLNEEKVKLPTKSGLTVSVGDTNQTAVDNYYEINCSTSVDNTILLTFDTAITAKEAQGYLRSILVKPKVNIENKISITTSSGEIPGNKPGEITQSQNVSNPEVIAAGNYGSRTLTTGVYFIAGNATFTGNDGQSGLIISGDVTIIVPSGVTLTAKGGDAYWPGFDDWGAAGSIGGGAGIELEYGNTLRIYGNGTLTATGGNAFNGCVGYDAWNNNEIIGSGLGGGGGGGAGAGIGGHGGNGGHGGTQNTRDIASLKSASYPALPIGMQVGVNENGENGSNGGGCGDIYASSSVIINATGGNPGYYGGQNPGLPYGPKTIGGGKVLAKFGGGGCGGSGYGAYGVGSGGGGGGYGKGYTDGWSNGFTGSQNGGSGGTAGAQSSQKSITYLTDFTKNHTYKVKFVGATDEAKKEVSYYFYYNNNQIIVPEYEAPLGKAFIGWKVSKYGRNIDNNNTSVLTFADSTIYMPGNVIKINLYTFGDIELEPVLEDIPPKSAVDSLSNTEQVFKTNPTNEVYNTYTVKLNVDGDTKDLGPLTFTDNNDPTKSYSVDSSEPGVYTVKFRADTSFSVKTQDGKDMNVTVSKETESNPATTVEYKTMKVQVNINGVGTDTLGDITLKNGDYFLAGIQTYNEFKVTGLYTVSVLSTNAKDSYDIYLNGEDTNIDIAPSENKIIDFYQVSVNVKKDGITTKDNVVTLRNIINAVKYTLELNEDGNYSYILRSDKDSNKYNINVDDEDVNLDAGFTSTTYKPSADKETFEVNYYTITINTKKNGVLKDMGNVLLKDNNGNQTSVPSTGTGVYQMCRLSSDKEYDIYVGGQDVKQKIKFASGSNVKDVNFIDVSVKVNVDGDSKNSGNVVLKKEGYSDVTLTYDATTQSFVGEVPTSEGYEVYINGEKTGSTVTPGTSPQETIKYQTIKFDSGSGSTGFVPEDKVYKVGDKLDLPQSAPEVTGKQFIGWSYNGTTYPLKPDGTFDKVTIAEGYNTLNAVYANNEDLGCKYSPDGGTTWLYGSTDYALEYAAANPDKQVSITLQNGDSISKPIPANVSIEIPKDVNVTIAEGTSIENNGTLKVLGTIGGKGTLVNKNKIEGDATNPGTITNLRNDSNTSTSGVNITNLHVSDTAKNICNSGLLQDVKIGSIPAGASVGGKIAGTIEASSGVKFANNIITVTDENDQLPLVKLPGGGTINSSSDVNNTDTYAGLMAAVSDGTTTRYALKTRVDLTNKITVNDQSIYANFFDIELPNNLRSNESPIVPTIKTTRTPGLGAVSNKMYRHEIGVDKTTGDSIWSDWTSEEPIKPGKYQIKFDVADGDNYSSTSSLTSPDWVYEITTNPIPIQKDSGDMNCDEEVDTFIASIMVGKEKELTAHIKNAYIDDDVKVYEGTDLLSTDCYKVHEGSLKITFNSSFVSSLRPGVHKYKIVLTQCKKTFTYDAIIRVYDYYEMPKTGIEN